MFHCMQTQNMTKTPSFDPPLVKMKADDYQRAARGPASPGLYCMDPKTQVAMVPVIFSVL